MAGTTAAETPLQGTAASGAVESPGDGIEVDLRWYVTGLCVIMAMSFMAGLQQSPLLVMDYQTLTAMTTTMTTTTTMEQEPADVPLVADRSKIVRDSFLVHEEDEEEEAASATTTTTTTGCKSEHAVCDAPGNEVDDDVVLTFDPLAAAAGEHLLVDIEGVDADFLDSESQLAQAMIDTSKEAGLELLSYHCHSLEPKGVSCVGVLLESHMSFHTWPDEGVITLDLYVTTVSTNTEQQVKQQPLVPNVVESVKRLFGVRGAGKAPRPLNARWSHEFRGFDPAAAQESDGIHLAGSDLALWVLSPLEMYSKTLIHTSWTQSNQRVDIWDLLEVSLLLGW